MLGEQADQRRAGEERRVADRADHRDPDGRAGRVVGRRAHPDREAQRRAHAPEQRADQRDRRASRRAAPAAARPARTPPSRAAPTTRPKRSSSAPPNNRPTRHRADEEAERDRADRLARRRSRRRSATAIQSLAEPSVKANPSTISPIEQGARLAPRGQRRRELAGASCSRGRRAERQEAPGERAPTISGEQHGDRRAAARPAAARAPAAAAPDAGAGDRADAEGGVQPRHERAAQPALDVGALDVHRDVPDAGAQPENASPSRGQRDDAGERGRRRAGPARARRETAPASTPRAGPKRCTSGPDSGRPGHRAAGQAEQQQAELGRATGPACRGRPGCGRSNDAKRQAVGQRRRRRRRCARAQRGVGVLRRRGRVGFTAGLPVRTSESIESIRSGSDGTPHRRPAQPVPL